LEEKRKQLEAEEMRLQKESQELMSQKALLEEQKQLYEVSFLRISFKNKYGTFYSHHWFCLLATATGERGSLEGRAN